MSLYEGDAFRIVAMHNVPPGLAELRRREPLVRAGPLLRIAETKRLLHIVDYTEYVASHPADSDAAAFAKLTGVRTLLEVPMLKDDDLVGGVVIYRTEVRRFDGREIALIKISPLKPSSPLRMHGCSTNSGSRWSNKPRLPRYCGSYRLHRTTLIPYFGRC